MISIIKKNVASALDEIECHEKLINSGRENISDFLSSIHSPLDFRLSSNCYPYSITYSRLTFHINFVLVYPKVEIVCSFYIDYEGHARIIPQMYHTHGGKQRKTLLNDRPTRLDEMIHWIKHQTTHAITNRNPIDVIDKDFEVFDEAIYALREEILYFLKKKLRTAYSSSYINMQIRLFYSNEITIGLNLTFKNIQLVVRFTYNTDEQKIDYYNWFIPYTTGEDKDAITEKITNDGYEFYNPSNDKNDDYEEVLGLIERYANV